MTLEPTREDVVDEEAFIARTFLLEEVLLFFLPLLFLLEELLENSDLILIINRRLETSDTQVQFVDEKKSLQEII